MRNYFKKGLSIIEILIIVAILGVIFSIISPQFAKIKENQAVKNGVQDILSSLGRARTQTLSSLNSSEYGVHFQSDKIIIFKGKVFSSGATDNENIDIITPALISNVTLNGVSGSSGDIYFNRISGSPSVTGTITISTSSFSKIITISATGFASSN